MRDEEKTKAQLIGELDIRVGVEERPNPGGSRFWVRLHSAVGEREPELQAAAIPIECMEG